MNWFEIVSLAVVFGVIGMIFANLIIKTIKIVARRVKGLK